MDESFDKAWNKMKERLKKYINLSYKEETFSVDFVKQKFEEAFQKYVFEVIQRKNLSAGKKVEISMLISKHSFFEPTYFPHDSENITNGFIYLVCTIIYFCIFHFSTNPTDESSYMKWFAIFPAVLCINNFRKKSVGLAYVNQLDSVYLEIKRIIEE